MEKSPEAFRTISEVAEDLDLPQHVLRFWETRFPQVRPLKRGGGRRYYRPEDVELLRAVKQLLYGEGYTIKGVQKLLREQGAPGLVRGAKDSRAAAAAIDGGPVHVAGVPEVGGEFVEETVEPAVVSNQQPGMRPQEAPAAPSIAPSHDLAQLRSILADLREAERILSQSRNF